MARSPLNIAVLILSCECEVVPERKIRDCYDARCILYLGTSRCTAHPDALHIPMHCPPNTSTANCLWLTELVIKESSRIGGVVNGKFDARLACAEVRRPEGSRLLEWQKSDLSDFDVAWKARCKPTEKA